MAHAATTLASPTESRDRQSCIRNPRTRVLREQCSEVDWTKTSKRLSQIEIRAQSVATTHEQHSTGQHVHSTPERRQTFPKEVGGSQLGARGKMNSPEEQLPFPASRSHLLAMSTTSTSTRIVEYNLDPCIDPCPHRKLNERALLSTSFVNHLDDDRSRPQHSPSTADCPRTCVDCGSHYRKPKMPASSSEPSSSHCQVTLDLRLVRPPCKLGPLRSQHSATLICHGPSKI